MKRALAIDVGTVRIGVAVSDPMRITANGLESYRRTGDLEKDAAHIAELLKSYEPVTLVVGMPRNMNGTYGPSADMAREFAEKINQLSPVETEFYDERLTTVSAERVLLEADLSRKKRRSVVDKMAAVIILQGYLDFDRNRGAK